MLISEFPGWRAAIFTGNPGLIPRLKLKPRRTFDISNGALPCKLATFRIGKTQTARPAESERTRPPSRPREARKPAASGPGLEMLYNRLRKNLRHYGRWARRGGISCYRLYDGDLPEYALAADVYHGAETWVHAQGYDPPERVPPEAFRIRQQEALQALREVLDVPPGHVHYKLRRRQKGSSQYGKLEAKGEFREVAEAGSSFWVNFTDYLDTGIYLDYRPVRARIREAACGRRFLNLFGYTGTATVCAAAGGAASSLTVDMSRTYLDWARRNLELNGLDLDSNQLEHIDCLDWLYREGVRGRRGARFDLILLDPPTFSNSKRMNRTFDIQRDHPQLITDTVNRLDPGGMLIFSTNRRSFRMEWEPPEGVEAKDITRSTIPMDFERSRNVHHCWEVVKTRP